MTPSTHTASGMPRFGRPAYGLVREIEGRTFDAVVQSTREALGTEGFGVLTEIDVAATFEKKLGIEVPSYVILGACNPPLAHAGLAVERGLGLLLPCNVVVVDEGDRVVVSSVDPVRMFDVVGREEVAPVAAEVRVRLERVMERV